MSNPTQQSGGKCDCGLNLVAVMTDGEASCFDAGSPQCKNNQLTYAIRGLLNVMHDYLPHKKLACLRFECDGFTPVRDCGATSLHDEIKTLINEREALKAERDGLIKQLRAYEHSRRTILKEADIEAQLVAMTDEQAAQFVGDIVVENASLRSRLAECEGALERLCDLYEISREKYDAKYPDSLVGEHPLIESEANRKRARAALKGGGK